MSDYNSSLPIRTENAGDVVAKIGDRLTPSQQLKVNADGSIDTNSTISATDLDIRDLSHTQDSVKVGDGTDFLAINNDGSINSVVSATDLDIRDLSHTQDSIKIGDGTDLLAVNADGSLNATVSATDLDIRDLDATQDNIAISDGTDTLAVNADGSLNIGNTVTVSATNLDIRDLSHSQDSIKIGDGTDFLAVNADGSINSVVSATDLDIRDLSAAQDSVKAQLADGSGNYYSASNPLSVAMSVNNAGTEVNNYNTAAAVASGATSNHDYTVTGGTTLLLTQIEAAGSGKMKIAVQIETASGSGVFNTNFVQFNSTSSPNMTIQLKSPISVVAGARVRIIRTNRDNQAQDLFSTICGQEV